MQPQYEKGLWYHVETDEGSIFLPVDLVGDDPKPEDFSDYCQGYLEHEKIFGVGARLSAPGYLDSTDWVVFGSLEEAKQDIEDTYEVDPETGEDLSQ